MNSMKCKLSTAFAKATGIFAQFGHLSVKFTSFFAYRETFTPRCTGTGTWTQQLHTTRTVTGISLDTHAYGHCDVTKTQRKNSSFFLFFSSFGLDQWFRIREFQFLFHYSSENFDRIEHQNVHEEMCGYSANCVNQVYIVRKGYWKSWIRALK